MRIVLFLISTILMTSLTVDAQGVGQRTKDKARWKFNNKIDQKIDKALDKGFNAIEDAFKKSEGEEDANQGTQNEGNTSGNNANEGTGQEGASSVKALSGLFGNMMKPANFESSYDFTQTFTMEMENYSKKGKMENKTDVKFFLDDEGDYFAVEMKVLEGKNAKEESTDVLLVHDYPNQTNVSVFVQDGQKQGFATSMEGMNQFMDKAGQKMLEENVEGMQYTKTGATKMINGYKCEQYIIESDQQYQEMWMTNDVGINMQDVFGKMVNVPQMQNIQQSQMSGDVPTGMMIQADSKDKKTGERSVMNVKDISKQPATIDLTPYDVKSVNDMINGYK